MHLSGRELYKQFGDREVVSAVTVSLQPGKILALLGPNGAGKSTTIKMLTGQLQPTSGTICVDEVETDELPESVRRRVGIMPQDIVVWEDLNIRENLEYSGRLHKLDAQTIAERTERLVADLQLEPEIKTLAKNLSGGVSAAAQPGALGDSRSGGGVPRRAVPGD